VEEVDSPVAIWLIRSINAAEQLLQIKSVNHYVYIIASIQEKVRRG
jgi:hypothetical protein